MRAVDNERPRGKAGPSFLWIFQLPILAALLATLLTALLATLSGTLLPRLALLLLTRLLAAALLATLLAALLLLTRLLSGFVLLHSSSFPWISLPGHRVVQRTGAPARSRFCWRQNTGTSAPHHRRGPRAVPAAT